MTVILSPASSLKAHRTTWQQGCTPSAMPRGRSLPAAIRVWKCRETGMRHLPAARAMHPMGATTAGICPSIRTPLEAATVAQTAVTVRDTQSLEIVISSGTPVRCGGEGGSLCPAVRPAADGPSVPSGAECRRAVCYQPLRDRGGNPCRSCLPLYNQLNWAVNRAAGPMLVWNATKVFWTNYKAGGTTL